MWTKTPISSGHYYNKAKSAYDSGQYSVAAELFEKVTNLDSNNPNARLYYAMALSKLEPKYTVQKKIYELANSKINDQAKQYAKSQIITIKRELLKGVEDNYIYNAVAGNNIIRWNINSFPLKIYIENQRSVPKYYMDNINKAFNQWSSRTNFVKFSPTNDKQKANIVIKFENSPSNGCDGEKCHYTVAYTTPHATPNGILKQMDLTFSITDLNGNDFSALEIYNSALHEIGHTLGLMGHSENPDDVMYSNNDKTRDVFAMYRSASQYLSMRDLKTLALLYRLEPNITDIKTQSENFYYPPLILGSNDEVLQKKLNEWEKYIAKYPELPSGYINLASIYSDFGDFENAIKYLDQAGSLKLSQDEKYLINYNKAVIYFNAQDYKKALQYANTAKSIKNDSTINELIEEIKKQ
ncbi:matrixin family metalloprotease [bacterium]|nr:matrixin family metalloprotease [bacterium]